MGRSRFQILFAVVALGLLAGAVIAIAYFFEKELVPEREALNQVEQTKTIEDHERPDPGKKAFGNAVELIKANDLPGARDRLLYMMKFYPSSAKYAEAKRILGEINADLLLSDGPGPGKYQYTIKRGDYLSVLAKKHQCTIDYIFRANSKTNHFVHIGDKVWVAPLLFSVEVNMGARTLTVSRIEPVEPEPGAEVESGDEQPVTQEVFFKEYHIADINLPPTVRVPYNTKVTSKPAWLGNQTSNLRKRRLSQGPKVVTKRAKLDWRLRLFRPIWTKLLRDEVMGILMSPSDMNELFTYIRPGAPVRLTN